MTLLPYILTSLPPYLLFSSSRDEKLVTATPLKSAVTNRDARNSFRIRSYENTGVALGISPQKSASLAFNSQKIEEQHELHND
jgi:hypothetical protein